MLKNFLEKTSSFLSAGRPEIYKEHPIAQLIRDEGKKIIESNLPRNLKDYKVEGSAGRGQWADIPWVSVYNLSVTDKANRGYNAIFSPLY